MKLEENDIERWKSLPNKATSSTSMPLLAPLDPVLAPASPPVSLPGLVPTCTSLDLVPLPVPTPLQVQNRSVLNLKK